MTGFLKPGERALFDQHRARAAEFLDALIVRNVREDDEAEEFARACDTLLRSTFTDQTRRHILAEALMRLRR
jgi:hypothetical protein